MVCVPTVAEIDLLQQASIALALGSSPYTSQLNNELRLERRVPWLQPISKTLTSEVDAKGRFDKRVINHHYS